MQSSGDSELIKRLINSLKDFGFFIFERGLYPKLTNLLKNTNTIRLVKIHPLGSKGNYYILEPDHTSCLHDCKVKCSLNDGRSDEECLILCITSCKLNARNTLIDILCQYLKSY